MEISFQGQYDKKLFVKAVRLANQPSRNQRRFISITPVFAVAAIGLMVYRILDTGDLEGNLILLLAALLLGGIVTWIYLAPYVAARRMWANPGTRRHLKGRINHQGIIYELEAGTNEIKWERFTRVRKADGFVTLVRNDGLLVVFPKSFFKKSSDWRKFLKLVEIKFAKA